MAPAEADGSVLEEDSRAGTGGTTAATTLGFAIARTVFANWVPTSSMCANASATSVSAVASCSRSVTVFAKSA